MARPTELSGGRGSEPPCEPRTPEVVRLTTYGLEDFHSEADGEDLELNTVATAEDGSGTDLALYPTPPEQRAVPSGVRRADDIRRPTSHASLLIAVTVGVLAGFLIAAAFLPATPDQPSPAASAATAAPTPRGSTGDHRPLPLDTAEAGSSAASKVTTESSSNARPSEAIAIRDRPPHTERSTGAATPSTEPPLRAPLDTVNLVAAVDLSGSWVVTNRIESTTYRAFENLRIDYLLRLTQDGSRILGAGQKWMENGKLLAVSRRTPITIEGTRTDRRLDLRFTETGARRTSGGSFVMQIVDEGTLSGVFTSDAANSRGSSVASKGPASGFGREK